MWMADGEEGGAGDTSLHTESSTGRRAKWVTESGPELSRHWQMEQGQEPAWD